MTDYPHNAPLPQPSRQAHPAGHLARWTLPLSLLALPLAPALIPAAVALSLSLLAHPFDRPAPRAVRAAFLLALLALLAGLALDLFWFLP